MKTYKEIIENLESRSIMPKTAPGLEKTRQGLERLRLSIDPTRVVLIAGTNGKGTTAAALEALLLSAGERVGLYTSPHLIRTTERIRMNGMEISEADFIQVFQEVDEKTRGLNLTHFETLTLMAAQSFANRSPKLDWWILEVGLGGIWDATNAIPHAHSVITTIDYDHTNILGNSLQEIAHNKFGIVHLKAPFSQSVYLGTLPKETEDEIARLESIPTVTIHYMPDFSFKTDPSLQTTLFSKWGSSKLALSGKRGATNANLALFIFSQLGFQAKNHLTALQDFKWAGRMERFHPKSSPCPIYLSGDHNPSGIESLLEILQHLHAKQIHFLIGVGVDKDLEGILTRLSTISNGILYLTETPFKGVQIENYGKWLAFAKDSDADPKRLLTRIYDNATPEDAIIVTGSLYLVGLIRSELLQKDFS